MGTQYRVPVLENFSWQPPVIDRTNTPPVSPNKGDRYLVGTAPVSGVWATHAKAIAWYDGTVWQFDTPAPGWRVWVDTEETFYTYKGTAWVLIGEGDMYKSVYDSNDNGLVNGAETVDDGVSGHQSSATQVADAVSKAHSQNTDQYVDYGGANQVSASQIKEAYDKRGNYDAQLKAILFNL